MTRVYLAVTHREDEIQALQRTKHPDLLFSFAMNGHKPSLSTFIDTIGYQPRSILVDPGSFTFNNKGVNTCVWDIFDFYKGDGYTEDEAADSLLYEVKWVLPQLEEPYPFHAYVQWVLDNQDYIDGVLAFDEIGSAVPTEYAYRVMKAMGLQPIPIFHYQTIRKDFAALDRYVEEGNPLIALGGTVREPAILKRIEWVRECIRRHPHQRFHFLGTQSQYVLKHLPEIYSCDGNAWKITAGFKKNRQPGQTKVEKAVEIINRLQRFST